MLQNLMTSTRINIFRRDGVKITQLKKSIQGEKKMYLKNVLIVILYLKGNTTLCERFQLVLTGNSHSYTVCGSFPVYHHFSWIVAVCNFFCIFELE